MSSPIYLALDFPDWKTGKKFLVENSLTGIPVKVGMELFYKEGPSVVEKLKQDGHEVFLDLKLHDIPNTVHKAMKNLALAGVDIVNIHATGGEKMISAAKEGLESGAGTGEIPKLLGVTVLTSFNNTSYKKAFQSNFQIDEMVLYLASLVKKNGGDGVVCSSWEAGKVREQLGKEFLTMCPGIRLAETAGQDQQRISTPKEAREKGAGAIVIGRSVTTAKNPYEAWEQAKKEWYSVIEA